MPAPAATKGTCGGDAGHPPGQRAARRATCSSTPVPGSGAARQVVADGTKRAGDAAYQLAAQLLAAVLNRQADAAMCSEALAAMERGQSLLAESPVNFAARGSYLGRDSWAILVSSVPCSDTSTSDGCGPTCVSRCRRYPAGEQYIGECRPTRRDRHSRFDTVSL